MITSRIYRHEPATGLGRVSTKKIRIDETGELYFQITSEQSASISLIESHLVEICSETRTRREPDDIFVTKVLDSLNRLILSQPANFQKAKLRAFIGLIRGSELSFSVCGAYHAYLQQEQKIMNIADGMGGSEGEFSFVSSGTIQPGDALFVSNKDLLAFLTKDDLEEFSQDQDPEIIENLISRESSEEEVHCLVFYHSLETEGNLDLIKRFNRSGPSLLDTAVQAIQTSTAWTKQAISNLEIPSRLEKLSQNPKIQELYQKKEVRVGIFAVGLLVTIGLLILIISSLFHSGMSSAVPMEYKQKLIEAQQILDNVSRNLANTEVYKGDLAKAEALVFEVRDQKIYSNDVKKLLDEISNRKRQLNGIESYDTTANPVLFDLPKDFEPRALFENAKRYFVVGKNGVYGPLIKGNEAKFVKFPDGEEFKSADITSEGLIYVLTQSNRVLKYLKGDFSYVNVDGQNTWEASSDIHCFIGNLYLLSEDGTIIYKHRPSINGFSSKSALTDASGLNGSSIADFTLENGFFAVRSDLVIEKIFTVPGFSRKGLTLNKLPDNFRLGNGTPRIAASPTANYLYLILDGRIWIMEPDSRNFKDIRALKYVGQIELPGKTIYSIIIPKDGEINTLSEKGISNIRFEVSDGKINLR